MLLWYRRPVKLAEWARREGVHYQTAWEWARDGKMPVPVYQTPSGSWMVRVETSAATGRAVAYCRVCSHDQKPDLERQAGRVVAGATAHGVAISEVVMEIGSGLNGKRRKLHRLLADPDAAVIVVEHRDRLARFGVEHLEAALAATGRRLVILEPDEATDDLVRDVTEVLTSMCARLYGRRSARNRAARGVAAAMADTA